jgi:hypothetical protein
MLVIVVMTVALLAVVVVVAFCAASGKQVLQCHGDHHGGPSTEQTGEASDTHALLLAGFEYCWWCSFNVGHCGGNCGTAAALVVMLVVAF